VSEAVRHVDDDRTARAARRLAEAVALVTRPGRDAWSVIFDCRIAATQALQAVLIFHGAPGARGKDLGELITRAGRIDPDFVRLRECLSDLAQPHQKVLDSNPAAGAYVDRAYKAACVVLALVHEKHGLPYRDPPRPTFD
jgi:HEPN domain-containing protein